MTSPAQAKKVDLPDDELVAPDERGIEDLDSQPVDRDAPAIVEEVRVAVANADPRAKIVTEHALIHAAYPDSVPICTDTFMNVSKDHYSMPWLVREIVQNFVDENTSNPASLDGVEFKHDEKDGSHVFTIGGNWPFKDPTGLISLHSGKSRSVDKKAGGNGIGLKQTILRFMRDYGVDEFSITGEGWKVSYRMADSESANRKLQERGILTFKKHRIENDWLLATVEESDNKGQCVYEIKTSNNEVASALDDFPNLGVSADNEHLKNPDYQNQHGSFRWIPLSAPPSSSKPEKEDLPKGRLFINGQVMNYDTKGKTGATYWDGPELVNLRLNNLAYDMSMDRPPVTSSDLSGYVEEMTSSMTEQECIDQLKKSEYIWSQLDDDRYSWHKNAAFVLIVKFIDALSWSRTRGSRAYNWERFRADFGENYLHRDKTLSEKEETELREKGYVLCPKYFDSLGVPPASGKLDALEQAKKQRPENPDMRWMAQREGIQVGFEALNLKKTDKFFPYFLKRFEKMIKGMEIIDSDKRRIAIDMLVDFDEQLFYQQMFTAPKDEKAMELYTLRGAIYYALKNKIFDEVVVSNGKLFITFALITNEGTGEEKLLTRVSEGSINQGLHAEVGTEQWVHCLKAVNSVAAAKIVSELKEKAKEEAKVQKEVARAQKKAAKEASRVQKEAERAQKRQERKEFSMPNYWFRRLVQASAIGFGAMGIWWCANNADYLTGQARQLASIASNGFSDAGSAGPSETNKYRDWMNGGKTYGQNGNKGAPKRSLGKLLSDYDNSGVKSSIFTSPPIEPPEPHEPHAQARGNDVIEKFEIIKNPTEAQIKQLELFRDYLYLTTGINVENNLFIYEGDGAYGINIGGHAIGVHSGLMNVDFDEALSTFVHEVAHNQYMDHGIEFRRLNSILHVAILDSVSKIAEKLDQGGSLTREEAEIIHIEARWDALRGK